LHTTSCYVTSEYSSSYRPTADQRLSRSLSVVQTTHHNFLCHIRVEQQQQVSSDSGPAVKPQPVCCADRTPRVLMSRPSTAPAAAIVRQRTSSYVAACLLCRPHTTSSYVTSEYSSSSSYRPTADQRISRGLSVVQTAHHEFLCHVRVEQQQQLSSGSGPAVKPQRVCCADSTARVFMSRPSREAAVAIVRQRTSG